MTSIARLRNVRNRLSASMAVQIAHSRHSRHNQLLHNIHTGPACHSAPTAVQEVKVCMYSLHVDSMAVPSLLCRSYITDRRGNYVRSDLVFRPRKHCGPASAHAVPTLVNAMLTTHHLTPITARCCQVYGQPTLGQACL